eukprot:c16865_g2_i1 orf=125-280(+)
MTKSLPCQVLIIKSQLQSCILQGDEDSPHHSSSGVTKTNFKTYQSWSAIMI